MITLTIDGRPVTAAENTDLLTVCLEHGVYIPHLCHLPESPEPGGACRLCLVEVQGAVRPLCACTVMAADGMVVATGSQHIRDLQKSALRLLLSRHHIDCGNCEANRRCGLQNVARFLEVRLQAAPHPGLVEGDVVDTGHPVFDIRPHRCILCGRCVRLCRQHGPRAQLSFAGRGIDTVVTGFGDEKTAAACMECQACIRACPVGALLFKDGSLPPESPMMLANPDISYPTPQK